MQGAERNNRLWMFHRRERLVLRQLVGGTVLFRRGFGAALCETESDVGVRHCGTRCGPALQGCCRVAAEQSVQGMGAHI